MGTSKADTIILHRNDFYEPHLFEHSKRIREMGIVDNYPNFYYLLSEYDQIDALADTDTLVINPFDYPIKVLDNTQKILDAKLGISADDLVNIFCSQKKYLMICSRVVSKHSKLRVYTSIGLTTPFDYMVARWNYKHHKWKMKKTRSMLELKQVKKSGEWINILFFNHYLRRNFDQLDLSGLPVVDEKTDYHEGLRKDLHEDLRSMLHANR